MKDEELSNAWSTPYDSMKSYALNNSKNLRGFCQDYIVSKPITDTSLV